MKSLLLVFATIFVILGINRDRIIIATAIHSFGPSEVSVYPGFLIPVLEDKEEWLEVVGDKLMLKEPSESASKQWKKSWKEVQRAIIQFEGLQEDSK